MFPSCADTDCPLREASSQRIPRLTVKVQHSAWAHSSSLLSSLVLVRRASDSSVIRCEGRHTTDVKIKAQRIYVVPGRREMAENTLLPLRLLCVLQYFVELKSSFGGFMCNNNNILSQMMCVCLLTRSKEIMLHHASKCFLFQAREHCLCLLQEALHGHQGAEDTFQ